MRYLIVLLLLFIGSAVLASERSVSVTIKPSGGIVGTVSFNIHSDRSVTVLVYESRSQITESLVNIDSETLTKVDQLSLRVFDEFITLNDYSRLPEYEQVSAISITQGTVTKSISTRRYSVQLISLIEMIKEFVPENFRPELERKAG